MPSFPPLVGGRARAPLRPRSLVARLADALARLASIAAWAALPALLGGCGALTGGAIVLLLPEDDGGDVTVVADQVAPVAFVDPVARVDGNVPIVYRLVDPNSDPIDVTVEVSIDGGATFAPAALAGGAAEGTSGLASSPGGALHTFLWDARADLGAGAFTRVVARVTPRDAGAVGAAGLSPGLATIGNDPPAVAVREVRFEQGEGNAKLARFTIDVIDSTSDLVDLDLAFEASGIAVGGAPLEASGVVTVLAGDTAALASAPEGVERSFVWNVVNDCRAFESAALTVTLTPRDAFEVGAPVARAGIEWTRDNAPVGFFQPVLRQLGPVEASFDLVTLDVETTCAVELFFEEVDPLTGRATSARFAPTLLGAPPLAGLRGEPLGARHAVTWNAPLDLAGVLADPDGRAFVRLGLIPRDEQLTPAATGFETFSNPFVIGNTLPVATVAAIPSPQAGIVPIVVTLEDDELDPASLLLEASLDGGSTFAPIPAGNLVGATAELATSLDGTEHTVAWNALRQLGVGTFPNVVVRVTPSDTDPGVPALSNPFTVSVTTDPLVLVRTPLAGQKVEGPTEVRFRLFQLEGGVASVEVAFQDGPAGPPAAATPLAGTVTSGLATSPEGVEHVFGWDVAADLEGQDLASARARVTATSGALTGAPGESRPFKVDENDEPVAVSLGVGQPDEASGFRVPLTLTVADAESDPASVEVVFVFDAPPAVAGVSIAPALEDADGAPLALPLTGVLGAVDLVWDAKTQLQTSTAPDLSAVPLAAVEGRFVVLPSDHPDPELGAGAALSQPALLDLTAPPTVTACSLVGFGDGDTLSGEVEVEVSFADPDSDAVEIVLEVRDLDQDEVIATRSFGAFAAEPGGATTTVSFTWPTPDDVSFLASAEVSVRAIDVGSGRSRDPFPVEGAFTIQNAADAEVVILRVDPEAGAPGVIRIRFLLRQPQSDFVQLAARFDFDDPENPLAGDCRDRDTNADASDAQPFEREGSPAGTDTDFVWDSRRNVGSTSGRVTVTIEPVSPPGLGDAVSFDLDNRREADLVIGRDDPVSGPASPRALDLDVASLATAPGVPATATASAFAAALARHDGSGPVVLAVPDPLNHRVLVWRPAPSETFRSATLVIGQPDFASNGPDAGGAAPGARGLRAPAAVAIAEVAAPGVQRLAVADTGNHRVLLFEGVPDQSFPFAASALGQPDLTTAAATSSPGLAGLASPIGVALFEGGLTFVVDKGQGGRGRLLGYQVGPIAGGAQSGLAAHLIDGDEADDPEPLALAADLDRLYVLRRDPASANATTVGVYLRSTLQAIAIPVTGSAAALDPDQVFAVPTVTAPGTGLLVFHGDPTASPSQAIVVGIPYPAEHRVRLFSYDAATPSLTPLFDLGDGTAAASADRFARPTGGAGTVFPFNAADGAPRSEVALIDAGNHRVLLGGPDPALPHQAALGQFDLARADPNAELTTDASLYHPSGVVAFPNDAGPFAIAIADRGNHRVLLFSAGGGGALSTGQAADRVIGQPGFSTRAPGSAPATTTVTSPPDAVGLSRPEGLALDPDPGVPGESCHLYIADTGNGRVLRLRVGASILDPLTIEVFADGLVEPCALAFLADDGLGGDAPPIHLTDVLYVADRAGGPRGRGSLLAFDARAAVLPLTASSALHVLDTVTTHADEVDLDLPNGVAALRASENPNGIPIVALADAGNDRVLLFSSLEPSASDLSAIVGANDLTPGGADALEDDRRLSRPSGLFVDLVSDSTNGAPVLEGGRLLVADAGHHRVLFFALNDVAFTFSPGDGSAPGSGSAPRARDLFGQAGFFARGANAGGRGAGTLFLNGVPGPAAHVGIGGTLPDGGGLRLILADPDNGRALGASGELDIIDPFGSPIGGGS